MVRRQLRSGAVRKIWKAACRRLRPRYEGGAVAIHLRTGRWVAGRDSRQAILRALKLDPKGQFEVLRIADRPTFRALRAFPC